MTEFLEGWKGPRAKRWDEVRAWVLEFVGMVGVAEIAARAGVRADTVQHWRLRYDDFPEPADELAMGPVWFWADVEPWIETHKATKSKGGRPKRSS